jgi:Flp pilus assembly protein TadD
MPRPSPSTISANSTATKPAVDGLDLVVPRGCLFGFLGPNGAGKSTTIRMLTGVIPPTSGSIELLGMPLAERELEIKQRIGLVPDESLLFDRLTARRRRGRPPHKKRCNRAPIQIIYVLRVTMSYGLMRHLAFMAVWPLLAASSPDLDQARKLYQLTDYQSSLAILQSIQPKDGPVFELIGRNHYMQGEYKKATEILEKAAAADPGNSEYELWLGRAFGRRAETASPFMSAGNANKARQHFERAVQLAPRNMDALSDLFEYYLEAPGFMGGGLDKAANVAGQMAAIDPADGQWAQARLAERRKEFDTAEHHFEMAARMAPQQASRLIDLAKFLAKQGRYRESDQSFSKAEKIAPNNPQLMYARAEAYIQQGRNRDAARKLLKRYLQAQLTPDDPPRAEAEKLLKKASGG